MKIKLIKYSPRATREHQGCEVFQYARENNNGGMERADSREEERDGE